MVSVQNAIKVLWKIILPKDQLSVHMLAHKRKYLSVVQMQDIQLDGYLVQQRKKS